MGILTKLSWLHEADNRLLVEQLRLIYVNMTITVAPTFPAIALVVWVIINDINWKGLLLWALVVTSTNAYSIFDARRSLARGLVESQAPKMLRKLLLSIAIAGASWGALAYGSLGHISPAGSVVVISLLGGVASGSVGLFSPVFAVYVAFVGLMAMFSIPRFFQLDDPAYTAFGFVAMIYFGTLLWQSYTAGRAVRSAIDLRFENLDLLKKTELAQKQAEQANADKSKFLAAASHDLRQPVHAQGLFLEALSRSGLSAEQAQVLASARRASDASGDMLNTLLDFSRVEAGVIQPFPAPFDLQRLLYKIENDLAPIAVAKGLAYRTRPTSAIIQSDALLVEMVLRNLVSNAIRYTEKGGVLIGCRLRQGRVVVEVWDTGIGIAPENQSEIFQEFHQLGNPERDRRKGLGLGLAIADGLAKTMCHVLSLQSTPGCGSVFRLALPISLRSVGRPTAPRAEDTLLVGLRVLVIDDDALVLMAMAHLARSWGCTVQTADSTEQAIIHAKLSPPDVVLSDYHLRGQQTGLEAIATLRILLGRDLPALIVTGDTSPDRLKETTESDISLLHKPLAPAQLRRALVSLLD